MGIFQSLSFFPSQKPRFRHSQNSINFTLSLLLLLSLLTPFSSSLPLDSELTIPHYSPSPPPSSHHPFPDSQHSLIFKLLKALLLPSHLTSPHPSLSLSAANNPPLQPQAAGQTTTLTTSPSFRSPSPTATSTTLTLTPHNHLPPPLLTHRHHFPATATPWTAPSQQNPQDTSDRRLPIPYLLAVPSLYLTLPSSTTPPSTICPLADRSPTQLTPLSQVPPSRSQPLLLSISGSTYLHSRPISPTTPTISSTPSRTPPITLPSWCSHLLLMRS